MRINRSELNAIAPSHAGEQLETLDIWQLWATLWASKWLIISIMSLCLFLGLVHNFLTQPLYSADVILQIENPKNSVTGADLGKELTIQGSANTLTAELQIVKSRLVLGEVADQFNLDIEAQPRYFPTIGAAIVRWRQTKPVVRSVVNSEATPDSTRFGKPILQLNQYAWGGEKILVDSFELHPTFYNEEFYLTVLDTDTYELADQAGTSILTGNVGKLASTSGRDADQSFSLLVSELQARPGSQFKLIRKSRAATIAALRDDLRIAELGDDSGIVKLELRGYDSKLIVQLLNAIAVIYAEQNKEQKIGVVKKNLAFLEERLPVVKSDLEAYEEELNNFRLDRGSVDLTLETQSTLGRIVLIEAELRDLRLKRQGLRTRFTAQHPSVSGLDAQRALLNNELKELEKVTNEMPETQSQILSLTRNVEVNTALYTALLTRAQELKIAMASATSKINILDPATLANQPLKPKKFANLVIVTALGGVLGLFATFIKGALVQGVEDPNELEAKLELQVLSTIPHSADQKKITKRKSRGSDDIRALAHIKPNNISIECLRNLRTTLYFSQNEVKNNIVLITSASPKVGKSFVSLNLAIVLANSGKKVVLVDADMRKGHLHEAFFAPQKPGLSEALTEGLLVDEFVETTKIENLSLVSTGRRPPNPSELLMSNRFLAFITNLSNRFDNVIIDAPPVLAAADAGIMGHAAGTTLLVIKAGANPIREIEQCKKRLLQNSVVPRGIILNDIVMTGKSKSYGGYVYQYGPNET